MSLEPKTPRGVGEEWMAMLFIGVIFLALIGFGAVLLLG
jgi:hypothetical protein